MMNSSVPILCFLVTIMCVRAECGCVFQGEVHPVGVTWHPATFGTCVNCTCEINERGEPDVRCRNTADKCPKLKCDNPKRDPHSCCPYCEDIPNIPPTVNDHEDESSSYKRANCSTPGGRIYKDGESYASNSTGIRRNSDNQCVMCNCQDGQPLCYLKTCHAPKSCSKFVQTEDDCCPVCADKTEVSWDDPAFYETVKAIGESKDKHDCLDTSGIKLNGSQWHPTIESIGEIDCITCTCHNGEIKCKKDCIPDHELPCRHPKTANGKCCRSCPEEEPGDKKKKGGKKKKNEKDRKGKKGNGKKRRKRCKKADKDDKKCKRRRKKRKERTSIQVVKPTMPTVGINLENLCIRKKDAYLVYKSITDKEMLIAFDDIEANTVDVHKWTVNKDEHLTDNQRGVVSYMEYEVISSTEFRKQINNTNVVGTAGKSQYKKFKRRLKMKLDTCRENCEPELFITIMQKVKVRLLKFGDNC